MKFSTELSKSVRSITRWRQRKHSVCTLHRCNKGIECSRKADRMDNRSKEGLRPEVNEGERSGPLCVTQKPGFA